MPGMWKSRTMQSGRLDGNESRNSRPDAKASTSRFTALSRRVSAFRTDESSSMTATRSRKCLMSRRSTKHRVSTRVAVRRAWRQGQKCACRDWGLGVTNEVCCLREPAGNQQPAHTGPAPAGSAPRHPASVSRGRRWLPPAATYLWRRSPGEHDAALIGAAKALTSSATIRTNFPRLALSNKAESPHWMRRRARRRTPGYPLRLLECFPFCLYPGSADLDLTAGRPRYEKWPTSGDARGELHDDNFKYDEFCKGVPAGTDPGLAHGV